MLVWMKQRTEQSAPNQARAGKRIRTLVVDDSTPVRRAVSFFLQRQENIEVVGTAVDGVDAAKKFEALRPELVVTDWQMPGMNGLQLALHLRSHYPDVKIILITVYDSPELREASAKHGADSFIRTDRLNAEFAGEIHRIFSPQAP